MLSIIGNEVCKVYQSGAVVSYVPVLEFKIIEGDDTNRLTYRITHFAYVNHDWRTYPMSIGNSYSWNEIYNEFSDILIKIASELVEFDDR